MRWWLWLLPALPATWAGLVGIVLAVSSRRWRPRPGRPARWLVLVPARGEGRAVEPTLASVTAAAAGHDVEAVLLLDGPDAEARAVADSLGVNVAQKEPAGPSKGAALAWAAAHLRRRIEDVDAVLVLDVGSALAGGFFDALPWPEGADAVQARLVGRGTGPGEAAALSERMAQRLEDAGREVLGWTVHLRGTGSAFTPACFAEVVPRLATRIEDTESTLLLAASGRRVVLAREAASVVDVKPGEVVLAARQRARWLAGQLALPVRQGRAVFRLVASRPLEGVTFLAELAARPLALSVPLRVVCAAVAMATGAGWAPWTLGGLAAATVATDLARLAAAGRLRPGAALRLAAGWLGALVMLPLGLLGWQRGRRAEPAAEAQGPRTEETSGEGGCGVR